ncbi:MAG: helix-turn-helix domain-containing protein [Limisphaerales bacterium]
MVKQRNRRPGKPGTAGAIGSASTLRRLARPTKGRLAHISDWENVAQRAVYSPSQVARLCQVLLRHLQRHFRDVYGLKLGSWLSALRLWRALLALHSQQSVKAVAYALGYKQGSHFSREFKKYHGIRPSLVQVLQPQPCHTGLRLPVRQDSNQLQLSFA